MAKFRRSLVSVLSTVLLVLSITVSASTITIGVVTDGPADDFGRIQSLFIEELLELTEGEFEIDFPEEHQLGGAWSIDNIQSSLIQLQRDPDVDLVLALGFVSSLIAARSENPETPTFAPLVLDSNLLELPELDGTSGVQNINYLTEEVRFTEDVLAFREIVPFQTLALIVDKTIFDSIPELAAQGLNWAQEFGIELVYVLSDTENEDIVAKVPSSVDAVMVAALPRLNEEARKQLIYHLNAEKLPSYSLIGTTPVLQGMLAATAPDSDWKRLARKNALNIQSVLLGESAGDQSISFKHKRQLTINMETARKIGISPRFDVLSSAVLINEEQTDSDIEWTLSGVANEALEANLEIQAGLVGVRAGAERINQARALLKPQFSSNLGLTQLDSNSGSVQSGVVAETTTSASISGSQILYSESGRANVEIEEAFDRSRVAEQKSLELDIVQRSTLAFLNLLKAQTFVDIQKSRLNLSRSNLTLAQNRVEIGSVTAADVYRWQSEVATDRQNLLDARAQINQAKDALNQLLQRPINEQFSIRPASLSDDSLMVSRQDLIDIIDNRRSFDLMGELMVFQGKQNSPELISLDSQIVAAERELTSSEKAFWSPDISLNGQVSRVLEESPTLSNSAEGNTDWQIGLTASLPLFEGGARKSRVSEAEYTIHQLNIKRKILEDSIEVQIRSNLHDVEASYPSIDLSQQAMQASAKNLELVQNNYSAGSLSIIELLDARDSALAAEQNAANSVYDFLIDLMNLQRSTAEFDFFLSAEDIQRTIEKIRFYISTPQ